VNDQIKDWYVPEDRQYSERQARYEHRYANYGKSE